MIGRAVLLASMALIVGYQALVSAFHFESWLTLGSVVFALLATIPLGLLLKAGLGRVAFWSTVLLDVVLVTQLVCVTSGPHSPLLLLYIWPVSMAAILLGAPAGYLVAAMGGAVGLALSTLSWAGASFPDLLAGSGYSSANGWAATAVAAGALLLSAVLLSLLSGSVLLARDHLLRTNETLRKELEAARAANRKLALLSNVGRSMEKIESFEFLLSRTLSHLSKVSGVAGGFMVLSSRGGHGDGQLAGHYNVDEALCRELVVAGVPREPADLVRLTGSTKEPHTFPAVQRENWLGELKVVGNLRDHGFDELVAAPVRLGDDVLGTLYVLSRPSERITPDDVALIASLTPQLAIAVKNILFTKELKAANEELLHLDQLKSDFLATMSHELRTPLTAIIGYSDMLLSGMTGELTEQQKQMLRSVLGAGENLLRLINDMLDLTKIEAGKLELDLKPVDLRTVLVSVLSVLRPKAKEKEVRVATYLAADLPLLWADPAKLAQILLNLLTNAVKFTPPTGVVTVEARPHGSEVEVRVTDSGIGIAPQDLERVFDRFTQLDSSSTRSQGGTGLGLAITRDLIDLHGGTVEVQSEVGRGSVFTFTIPQAVAVPEPVTTTVAQEEAWRA